ncbi:MAG: hypothetical protein WCO65_01120 [bacterium]
MSNLSNISHTISVSIASIGYVPFGIMVIVNIILYKLHPVLGFLGTLFLFAILIGILK